jgi:hypothetical protein
MRKGGWMVFSRVPCHRTHRPGQADSLHVDLWRGTENLAIDPGTYAYSEPPPWDNRLAETRVHNTCSVGECSQMRRRGRFLWTDWSCATVVERASDRFLARVAATWEGSHVHWRLVLLDDDGIDVLDRVVGTTTDAIRVHWNLAGTDWRRDGGRWSRGGALVAIAAPDGSEVRDVRGDPSSELGWTALGYGRREPCTAVEVESRSRAAWFHTRIGASPSRIRRETLDVWIAGKPLEAFHALLGQPVPRDA